MEFNYLGVTKLNLGSFRVFRISEFARRPVLNHFTPMFALPKEPVFRGYRNGFRLAAKIKTKSYTRHG